MKEAALPIPPANLIKSFTQAAQTPLAFKTKDIYSIKIYSIHLLLKLVQNLSVTTKTILSGTRFVFSPFKRQ